LGMLGIVIEAHNERKHPAHRPLKRARLERCLGEPASAGGGVRH